jgi:tol-pal system protein YbgF
MDLRWGVVMKTLAAALMSLAAAAAPAAAQMPGSRAPGDGNAALAARLERLEQQIADLQGVVAAVETLARNNAGGGGGYPAAGGGASSEQIRQLSEQIADLTQRLERLEGGNAGEGGARPFAGQSRQGSGYGASPAPGFEDKEQLPPLTPSQGQASNYGMRPQQGASATQPRPYGYEPAGTPPRPAPPPLPAPAAAPAAGPARALFDQGTGALNRREYSAAETYFQQFLDQYPADPLAGSAQYWLGETAFVSGEYKAAADRFLKTFTAYPTNERAPEALLKLAISLRRLGNNADACATFSELTRRYPRASQSVQQRADAEKKRANCS